ncbi:MAG: hypothetical protein QM730_23650 [Anaerolineales bacterium]
MLKRLSSQSVSLWLLVIVFAASLSVWYISRERVFYFWDYAFYMDMAVHVSKMFIHNPFQAINTIYLSTSLDYNYYFAVPLIPFLEVFRYSRLGYILGLVFVYHVPAMIACGYVVRRIFPFAPYAGWITILAGLSVPALWASVFRGFPDTGAVFLITLAIIFYLQDMELKQWRVQLPMIGVISALAVIFRRHFAYSVISFWFSIGIFLMFYSIKNSGKDKRRFILESLNILVKILIVLLFFFLSIILLAPGLLLKFSIQTI